MFFAIVLLPGSVLWAQSACDDFTCNPSGQIMCNADLDCTRRQPFCINGVCQARTCNNDGDCPSLMACFSGTCEEVDCKTAEDCSTGKACINHRCEGCDNNAQCGERGVCQNNECVCVECRISSQCNIDEKCSNNTCVDFCDEGKIFVSAQDGDRLCKDCIELPSGPEIPDRITLRCDESSDCLERTFCAQGFCISRCNLASRPLDFNELDEFLQELKDLLFQSFPGGAPECPRCTIGFEMIGVRGVLERAGMTKPVHLRLLDSSGKLVADLGTFSPKGRSWATIPELIQPKLMQAVSKDGGCNYWFEVSDPRSKKAVRGAVCLEQDKKSLPLKRSL